MKFYGYLRPDGRVGIRNHILILPVSICASDVARKIHERVEGTITFHNHLGCSQSQFDQECTIRTMAGLAANPNVFGTVLISLGCENCQLDLVEKEVKKRTNKPLYSFSIQDCHGMSGTIRLVEDCAKKLVKEAHRMKKTLQSFSKIIIGTECGGSDPTSGLCANPLIGSVIDKVIDNKGTAILSETTEFIGAEKQLVLRSINDEIRSKIYKIIDRYEESQKIIGHDIRERNPSPGNKAGGITTLEEKSLGCILKSGHRSIIDVIDYAEDISQHGLVIMDTPGNDSTSMMGMVAGGCQLILFSTGRGTPMGNPLVPVIKVCANSITCQNFKEHIDYDASYILKNDKTMKSAECELFTYMIDVIEGSQTSSERLDFYETSIARVGKYRKNGRTYTYYY